MKNTKQWLSASLTLIDIKKFKESYVSDNIKNIVSEFQISIVNSRKIKQ